METPERLIGARRRATIRELAELFPASNVEDVCRKAVTSLARNTADIPFAVLYLVNGNTARRVGFTPEDDSVASAFPPQLALVDSPFGRLLDERRPLTMEVSPAGALIAVSSAEPIGHAASSGDQCQRQCDQEQV